MSVGSIETLIDSLLLEQEALTAVERFAQFHEEAKEPLRKPLYSALLPARPPGPGQQYAFEVDLDRCSGCKACVTACHSLNGLEEGEAWREVGMLVGGGAGLTLLQHVTTACHHCLDPACLTACPVDAYEKDPITGIVKHLDDQCFGCTYCTLACPYDVPRYLPSKGIVRKCDMCSDRLRAGEAPACVQACPHEAIRIRVVDVAEIEARAASGPAGFLPAAPGPEITRPTTVYRTAKPLPNDIHAADRHRLEPEPAHPPLIVMLVLTQLWAGTVLVDGWDPSSETAPKLLTFGLAGVLGLVGMGASLAHLGRPWYAYRAFIGLGHSWLSREIAALSVFAGLASMQFAALALGWGRRPWLDGATMLAGAVAVLCSAMVYHVVRRPLWHAGRSVPLFAGTALALGLGVTGLAGVWSTTLGLGGAGVAPGLGVALAVIMMVKIGLEARLLNYRGDVGLTPLKRSALLILGPLKRFGRLRLALGSIGGVVLALSAAMGPFGTVSTILTTMAFLALIGGEFVERFLFFAAVTRPKMPGGPETS